MTDWQGDLALALELADEADRISLAYFRSDRLVVDTKPDLTPVSQADKEVEQTIRSRLATLRPTHSVLGEEFGGETGSDYRWIIDPIDGTKRYVRGVPVFATLLALEHLGSIVLGVVSAPALRRRWWAARGLGAYSDGRPIHVSAVQKLSDAHVSLASVENWLSRDLFAQLGRIAGGAWTTTGYGDFWCHLLVAEGVADASLEPAGAIWDFAPLKIIVEQAGGKFTDFTGQSTAATGNALASNGAPIHGELLQLLQPA
jgi:histidinol-phosphatase